LLFIYLFIKKRTIGLKKDEFFIQRKRATKKEIASLLEGAGFSKGKFYFYANGANTDMAC